MIRSTSFLLSICLGLCATQAFAVEPIGGSTLPAGMVAQKLVTIDSDHNSDIDVLSIVLDQHGMVQGLLQDRNLNADPKQLESTEFAIADIESTTGVVLTKQDKYDVIFLQGKVDEKSGSGNFSIRYLSNGLSMKYKSCPVDVKLDDQGQWHLLKANTTEVIKQIHVVTSIFGVKALKGACQ